MKGKKLNKTKLSAMPKFTRPASEDPHAPVKRQKIPVEDMIKKVVHEHDEEIGIY